ncbi:MAG: 3-hydroxyacyl-CoA dehydrogenase NAD-binding domain-containing protein [Saprospiraceae bacterium]
MIKYRKDTDDIITLTLDMKGDAENIINHKISRVFEPIIRQLQKDVAESQVIGVIITSDKKNFLTGGDLEYIYKVEDAQAIFSYTEEIKGLYRRLEKLGVPVVAAINGNALGSGFELALACHHRIAVGNPQTRIGFPEVRLGLMPSAGGVTRLVWLNGLKKTFPILTDGKIYRPIEALKYEIIDEVAVDEKEMIQKAKNWIFDNLDYKRPWDQSKYIIPGGNIESAEITNWIAKKNAALMKKTKGNFPAIQSILATMVEAASVDFDTANRIESRYFTELIMCDSTRNMVKAFWFDTNKVKQNLSRPKGYGKFRPKQIGIIGAGRMGSGIATTCAIHGMQVILKDVSQSIAERGRKYCDLLLQQKVDAGEMTIAEKTTIFNRISISDKFQDFSNCDVVIEAVFENLNLKRRVIRETDAHLDEFTLFGTNTSNISISRLGKASNRPQDFVGIHFYAPAEKRRLVDVIVGEQTSDETIAKAFDFVRKIRKIPIVIRDRRGFFAARINGMYAMEGLALLNEGVPPVVIERLGMKAGMQKGPLATLDEMSLATLLLFERRKKEWFGDVYYHKNELKVLVKMVEELKREGAISKAGFYNYNGKKPLIWSELSEHFDIKNKYPDEKAIIERFMFVQAIDAARALEEGTINSVEEANVGSILGWNFAPFKGGVFQYINDYGINTFVKRAKQFEQKYGSRFTLPEIILAKAKRNELF